MPKKYVLSTLKNGIKTLIVPVNNKKVISVEDTTPVDQTAVAAAGGY